MKTNKIGIYVKCKYCGGLVKAEEFIIHNEKGLSNLLIKDIELLECKKPACRKKYIQWHIEKTHKNILK